jgi:hypothetical protein
MMPLLVAFQAWRDKWRPQMEMFEMFAGRQGGWGVFRCTDEVELSQMMMEYPFTPYSVLGIHPTVDGDTGLKRLTQTVQQQMAAMGMAMA